MNIENLLGITAIVAICYIAYLIMSPGRKTGYLKKVRAWLMPKALPLLKKKWFLGTVGIALLMPVVMKFARALDSENAWSSSAGKTVLTIAGVILGLFALGIVLLMLALAYAKSKRTTSTTPPALPSLQTKVWGGLIGFSPNFWVMFSGVFLIALVFGHNYVRIVFPETAMRISVLLGTIVVMLASFRIKTVRDKSAEFLKFYAIWIATWLIIGAYIRIVEYQLMIKFSDHIRESTIVLWIIIPGATLCLAHFKSKILKTVFIVIIILLWNVVKFDALTSPKTAEIASIRGAPPTPGPLDYDVSGSRFTGFITYPSLPEYRDRPEMWVTNQVALTYEKPDGYSFVERLVDGKVRYYNWRNGEYYGTLRDQAGSGEGTRGRFKMEARYTSKGTYYDALLEFETKDGDLMRVPAKIRLK